MSTIDKRIIHTKRTRNNHTHKWTATEKHTKDTPKNGDKKAAVVSRKTPEIYRRKKMDAKLKRKMKKKRQNAREEEPNKKKNTFDRREKT